MSLWNKRDSTGTRWVFYKRYVKKIYPKADYDFDLIGDRYRYTIYKYVEVETKYWETGLVIGTKLLDYNRTLGKPSRSEHIAWKSAYQELKKLENEIEESNPDKDRLQKSNM